MTACGVAPRNPLEVPHLRKLDADLEQLSGAFNQNTKIFSHGLALTEVYLRVHERVITAMFNGDVRFKEENGKKVIDFRSYVDEFIAELKVQEEAAKAQAEVKSGPGPILAPSADDTIIFGGSP